jgi:hypothetical protein
VFREAATIVYTDLTKSFGSTNAIIMVQWPHETFNRRRFLKLGHTDEDVGGNAWM